MKYSELIEKSKEYEKGSYGDEVYFECITKREIWDNLDKITENNVREVVLYFLNKWKCRIPYDYAPQLQKALKKSNNLFIILKNDILSAILNEPIKGNAYVWSAPDQPFVLSLHIENFQKYVEELIRNTKEVKVEITPTEDFSRKLPDMEKKFNSFVSKAILSSKPIKIYENVIIDGNANNDVVATLLWNLKFGLTNVIGPDLERMFCEKSFEDKPPVVRDDLLFKSLEDIGFLSSQKTLKGKDNKPYVILKKSSMGNNHKVFDVTPLELSG